VLGLGAAHGDELAPISKRAERVTVLEPTDAFTRAELHGVPASYVKPGVDGGMPFEDARFDLVTCFGVLHHICTVTRVLNEIGRVTARNGWLLVREPVVSMGDWRRPRGGLTRRERGIPPHLLRERVERAGFEIVRFAWCFAPVVSKPLRKLVGPPYNSPLACRIDALASSLLSVNFHYHATSAIQKFRPTCAFVVGRRR
jgi:SAM-dependent methyltransferase